MPTSLYCAKALPQFILFMDRKQCFQFSMDLLLRFRFNSQKNNPSCRHSREKHERAETPIPCDQYSPFTRSPLQDFLIRSSREAYLAGRDHLMTQGAKQINSRLPHVLIRQEPHLNSTNVDFFMFDDVCSIPGTGFDIFNLQIRIVTPNPAKPDPIVDFRLMIGDLRYRFALSFLSVCTERQLSRAWRVTCLSSHRLKRQEHVSAAELNLLGKNPAQT